MEQCLVGFENEVVVKPRAAIGITASGRDEELRGGHGLDLQMKVESNSDSVKARTKISRSCGQPQAQRSGIG